MKAFDAIPKEVLETVRTLKKAGFQAYLVGGCVRDTLMGKKPKDWDIATSANPDEIIAAFPDTFYENDYGTVGVVNENATDDTVRVIEVTPFRVEGKYTDGRRPDEVHFSTDINDDLKRRDFTINAIAYDPEEGDIIDPYKGQDSIKDKLILTVGSPEERFSEDYLRMLRAVRLASQLGFTIHPDTQEAIKIGAENIEHVSQERIRDEFIKIVDSPEPRNGINLARELGIFKHIIPELEAGIDVEQRGPHLYDVWDHNMRAMQHAADKGWPFHVKLAALLHDVAKPQTRRWSDTQKLWTFYGHDVVGGRVSREILRRLRFPKETTEVVSKLVRYHLFFSDPDKVTLSAVRRLVKNVGTEHIWDLMKLRACDRIGTGRPKEAPYRLRKYESMIDEVMRDPISVGMLKIDGAKIMSVTREKPGPRIGWILHALLEQVLDDPARNTETFLVEHAGELSNLNDDQLRLLGEKGRGKKEEDEASELKDIRKRHWVE